MPARLAVVLWSGVVGAARGALVVHCPFDGGAPTDASGNGFDAIVAGAPAKTPSHDGGDALDFDGASDALSFPAAATANILGDSPRTLCAWARVDTFDGGPRVAPRLRTSSSVFFRQTRERV